MIKNNVIRLRHIGLMPCILAAAIFFLFLIRSDTAIDYMKKGLVLCASTVIPSLFPFMVISELLVECGFGQYLGKLFSKPTRLLFGVSEECTCAFILGLICGFPIGAKTLCRLYDNGMISSTEFSRAMTFCNNPGSAFVISAVGASLFEDSRKGAVLYICVILSSIATGIISRTFTARSIDSETVSAIVKSKKKDGGIAIFTRAVGNSALSMLTVCAYVAFFSSLVGCIGSVLNDIGASGRIIAAIFGIFEISSGVSMAAGLESLRTAFLMCAAVLGWSGLSVHLQIATICSGRRLDLVPYFAAKLIQSVLCTALAGIMMIIFKII